MAHTNPNNPTGASNAPQKAPAAYDPFHGRGLLPTHEGPVEEHTERHEHTDVPIRPLKIFLISMIVLGIVIHVGLYVLFGMYDAAEVERDKARVRSALARTREEKLPPQPRIQGVPSLHAPTPREDTDEMRRQNDLLLNTYGTTADGKFARVPVAKAMDLALQNQIFKKAGTSNPQAPTTRPTTNNQSGNAQQR